MLVVSETFSLVIGDPFEVRLITIYNSSSVIFQVECAQCHFKGSCCCAEVIGSRRKKHREVNFRVQNCLLMVAAVTEALDALRINDNDECVSISAALMIDRSSRSVASLGRPLTS